MGLSLTYTSVLLDVLQGDPLVERKGKGDLAEQNSTVVLDVD